MIGSDSDISKRMEYFLATGNIQSKTGLDLMQVISRVRDSMFDEFL